jgi:hypothetical protein
MHVAACFLFSAVRVCTRQTIQCIFYSSSSHRLLRLCIVRLLSREGSGHVDALILFPEAPSRSLPESRIRSASSALAHSDFRPSTLPSPHHNPPNQSQQAQARTTCHRSQAGAGGPVWVRFAGLQRGHVWCVWWWCLKACGAFFHFFLVAATWLRSPARAGCFCLPTTPILSSPPLARALPNQTLCCTCRMLPQRLHGEGERGHQGRPGPGP